MADSAPRARRSRHRVPNPEHKKHVKLPSNAKVTKRPLLRPAISSPYAGASQPKVVYVSARTPFISAVKRVEKLLHLVDKRLVQSATAFAKQKTGHKRKRNTDDGDEVLEIAREVERQKGKRRKVSGGVVGEDDQEGVIEEVLVKGTGKAIQKVMEMGVWFQQREQYAVRLRTGSVGAIDDIEVEENVPAAEVDGEAADGGRAGEPEATAGAEAGQAMDVDGEAFGAGTELRIEKPEATHCGESSAVQRDASDATLSRDAIPETRIRYMSMLEVAVSLR